MNLNKFNEVSSYSISNKYTSHIVELRSTSYNNNVFAYVRVNDKEITRVTTEGYTILWFDKYMKFLNQTSFSSPSQASSVPNNFSGRTEGQTFIIVTFGRHFKVPYFYNNLHSLHMTNIHERYNQYNKVPWGAIGRILNGVPTLTHEGIGSTDISPKSNLILVGGIECDYNNTFISTGVSKDMLENQRVLNYNGTTATSGTIPLNKYTKSGFYEFSLYGRIKKKATLSDGRQIAFNIYRNNVLSGTIVVQSDISKTYRHIIPYNINDNIELRYVIGSDTQCMFQINCYYRSMQTYRNFNFSIGSQSINTNYWVDTLTQTSILDTVDFSNNEFPYMFVPNSTKCIGHCNLPTTLVEGEVSTTSYVFSNRNSYSIFGFVKPQFDVPTTATFKIESLDDNDNVLDMSVNGMVEPHFEDSYNVAFRSGMFNIPIFFDEDVTSLPDCYHGFINSGERGIEIFDKRYILSVSKETRKIRLTINANNLHVSFKCIENLFKVIPNQKNLFVSFKTTKTN